MMAGSKHIIDQCRLSTPPLSGTRYVFFLRAIGLFGTAKYGELWGDADQKALELPPIINPPISADAWFELMKEVEPPHPDSLKRNHMVPRQGHGLSMRAESEEQFAARQALAAKRLSAWKTTQSILFDRRDQLFAAHVATRENSVRANRLLRSTFVELRQAIIDGEIKAYLRSDEPGAQWMPLRASDISSIEVETTLLGRGSLRRRYDDFDIFVDRADLETWTSRFAHSPLVVSGMDLSLLPEPLKIAVKLALSDPALPSKSEGERRSAAAASWIVQFPGLQSSGYIEAIAKVLGIPDLQKIKRELERAERARRPKI